MLNCFRINLQVCNTINNFYCNFDICTIVETVWIRPLLIGSEFKFKLDIVLIRYCKITGKFLKEILVTGVTNVLNRECTISVAFDLITLLLNHF